MTATDTSALPDYAPVPRSTLGLALKEPVVMTQRRDRSCLTPIRIEVPEVRPRQPEGVRRERRRWE